MQQQRDNSPSQLPACAACKHQRKKCAQNCVLAPYFPANMKQEFEAVHQVFGVSNVSKTLSKLSDEEEKRSAIESIIWEAMEWRKNKSGGPLSLYRRALQDVELYKQKAESYKKELEMYKQKGAIWSYGNGQIVNGGAGTVVPAPGYLANSSNGMMSHIRHNGYHNFDRSYGYDTNNSSFVMAHRQPNQHQQQETNGFASCSIAGQYNSVNNGNGKIVQYNSVNHGNSVNNGNGNGNVFDNSLWGNDT